MRDAKRMNSLLKSASAGALLAMLAACGGGADEEQADSSDLFVAGQPTAPATTPAAGETPVGEATPAAEESPAATETAPTAEPAAEPAAAAIQAPAAAPPAQAAAPAEPPPIFAVCAACHSATPGDHGIGPSLAGVFGARAAHAEGFGYSQPMENSGLTWNEAALHRYLENPRAVVPGTTMAYAGLRNATQRQAVVDYLKGL